MALPEDDPLNELSADGLPAADSSARPLCYVVDDVPAITRMIARTVESCGVEVRQIDGVPEMMAAFHQRRPDLIFLDISLGNLDAVDAIRALGAARYAGTVQLMSGRDAALLDDVRRIGERHGMRMLPGMTKPFRIETVQRIVTEHFAYRTEQQAEPDSPRQAPPRVDLGEALRAGWMELWYQPKLDVRARRVTGAEGLARVRHPELGVLFPGSFIPGAREADLVALAEQALHRALRDARELAEDGLDLQLAINVPVNALLNLPVAAIAREYLPRDDDRIRIILELTEDQVIADIPAIHEIATQLRIHRVGMAIDDFGTGYSSLARLKDLPFAELKLDQSFVGNCGNDASNAALCRAVVELAHRFGSAAVAEGVERSDDLMVVADAGCDIVQGFLFAKAMPKSALTAAVARSGRGDGLAEALAVLDHDTQDLRYGAA